MIEVSSFSVGKNLCNILAELIVKEIDKNSPGAKTEISVVNVRSFCIVKGFTSSNNVIEISEIFKNFYKDYCGKPDQSVKVFDLITYSKNINSETFHINFSLGKKEFRSIEKFQSVSNQLNKDGYDVFMKVDQTNQSVHYDVESIKLYDDSIFGDLTKNYSFYKSNFSYEVYQSDKFYGLSNNGVKYYYVLANKIIYNLFNRGFCNNIKLSISNNLELDKIDNESINFKIQNDITKKDFLESLILDNFDFTIGGLQKEFDLSKIDTIDYLKNGSNQIWENYHNTKDFIFL